MDMMTESTLVSFRRAIATHIAEVTDQSVDNVLPLVQQNTSHRKASHSVFSVVIKRLQSLNNINNNGNGDGGGGGGGGGGGVAVLDDDLLERCCTELSTETREWVLQARRTKDMLLFDPQPLQLIRLAVGSIMREYGQSSRIEGGIGSSVDAAEDKSVEEMLKERAYEETSSGEISSRKRRRNSSSSSSRRGSWGKKVVIVDGVKTLQDENAFCCLRRMVLTGFVARCFLLRGVSEEEEGNEVPCVKVIADQGEEFLQGLYVESPTTSTTTNDGDDYYLEIIKRALQTIPELKAQKNTSNNTNTVEDGAWVVDLSAHKLGLVKMFSLSSSASKEVEDPTAVVEMMVSMARRFEKYDKKGEDEDEEEDEVARYIWVVPDGRRLFAEQVLHLARIIFPGPGVKRIQSDSITEAAKKEEGAEEEEGDEPERKKRAGARLDLTMEQLSWIDRVEVVYYGPAAGVDLLKNPASILTASGDDMNGVVEYTNIKMREVVEDNRGSGGVGGYSGAYGDDDGYNDDDEGEGDGEGGLDEAELSRMSNILSQSALVVACCGGKRVKKLNISLSRILDGKGNSGVFLQYVLSRLYGIERKSKTRLSPNANLELISSFQEALDLSLLLAEYPELTSTLQSTFDPFALISYLFNLAAMVGQANRVLRVKGMEKEVAEARWVLFWAAKRVLEEGLKILGLEFLERM